MKYDLEHRVLVFAKEVRRLVKGLTRTPSNKGDIRQLVRASGSVGANYLEANNALGKKDSRMRIKICRKEAAESRYWLRLLDLEGCESLHTQLEKLIQESGELTRIFGAILRNSQ